MKLLNTFPPLSSRNFAGAKSPQNFGVRRFHGSTSWKINMEPQNDGLEDDFPFQLGDF